MTAAVIASTEGVASLVAHNLGLGVDWIYPRTEATPRGYLIDRIIAVDDWRASRIITPAIMDEVTARSLALDVEEIANPHANASTARLAGVALDAIRRGSTPPPVPAVSGVAFMDAYRPAAPRRRRSWLARLIRRRA